VSLPAEIVAAARAMHRLGLVAATQGNVSARDGELVVITPTGLAYEEMSEADLLRLSLDGEVVGGEREPSSERRLHLAVYAARPDVGAIAHTHSPHATAWSFLGEPLEAGEEDLATACGGPVRTTAPAPAGSDELARAAVEALAGRRAALLARHGVVGLGPSPAAALDVCAVVEHQARVARLLRGERRG
jgi:L-fuculose-phosphate aldolase